MNWKTNIAANIVIGVIMFWNFFDKYSEEKLDLPAWLSLILGIAVMVHIVYLISHRPKA
jgi:predicted membrane protein